MISNWNDEAPPALSLENLEAAMGLLDHHCWEIDYPQWGRARKHEEEVRRLMENLGIGRFEAEHLPQEYPLTAMEIKAQEREKLREAEQNAMPALNATGGCDIVAGWTDSRYSTSIPVADAGTLRMSPSGAMPPPKPEKPSLQSIIAHFYKSR
jgi:hypothetical protein